jgi:hypothetical protein
MARPLVLRAAAISVLLGVAVAAPLSTTRIHFDASGRALLQVSIAGTPRTFVLDTATAASTVSTNTAATVGLPVRTDRHGAKWIDDASLELLGVVLPHQALRVSDGQAPEDGLIGAELCNRFIVKVDFRSRRVTLWERSTTIDTRRAVVVPADFSSGVPRINVRIRAPGIRESAAALVVGLTLPADSVSFRYRYAAESGLLDASPRRKVAVEIWGVRRSAIPAVGQLPREPERDVLLFADAIVSARVLTSSWIVFDAAHGRIALGS